MRDDHVVRLARELGDPEVARRLLAVRAEVVTDVPDEVARRHLRTITLAAGFTAATVSTVSGAAAGVGGAAAGTITATGASATGAGAAAAAGATAGGSVVGGIGGLKLGVAALATAVATAGGLGATGHLPQPAQRIVDEVAGRDTDPRPEGPGPEAPQVEGPGADEPFDADHTRRAPRAPRSVRPDRGGEVTRDRGTEDRREDAPGDVTSGPRADVGGAIEPVHPPVTMPPGTPPPRTAPPTTGGAPVAPPGGSESSGPAVDGYLPPAGDGAPRSGETTAPGRSHEAPAQPGRPGPPSDGGSADRSGAAGGRADQPPASPRAPSDARTEAGPPDAAPADAADERRGGPKG